MSPWPPCCVPVAPCPAAVLRHPPLMLRLGRSQVDSEDVRGLLGTRLHCPSSNGMVPQSWFRVQRNDPRLHCMWGVGGSCRDAVLSGSSQMSCHLSRSWDTGTLLPSGSEHSCVGNGLSPRGKFSHIPERATMAVKAPWGRNQETETPTPKYICHLCILSTCGMYARPCVI